MLQSIKQKQEAKKELNNFIKRKVGVVYPTKRLRQILPLYGIVKGNKEVSKYILHMNNILKEEIKKGELVAEDVEYRINELLTHEYGEPISQEEANKRVIDYKVGRGIDKEKELEQKFNISFEGKKWFKCSIEEERKRLYKFSIFKSINRCNAKWK